MASGKLYTMPASGGEPRPVPSERYDGVTGLAWAPDQTRIYFLKAAGRRLDIWSEAPDGSQARQVMGDVKPGSLAISPDGRTVVFFAVRSKIAGIWRADAADGANARQIIPSATPPS